MLEESGNDEETDRARKAIEVAQAYFAYEEILKRNGVLDYGDLIFKAVTLLQTNSDVRDTLARQYKHILVDEYQDVNTASKVFLKELAGDGEGLWVVGDALQSIYRFRGAAPGNMREFAKEYPKAQVLPLERNYRSQKQITGTFSGFAKKMAARPPDMFTDWESARTETNGAISYEVGVDETAEGKGIAKEIVRLKSLGVAHKEQAVLARSHTALQRLAIVLEKENIPLFYLGDLFERSEVRDLLSLVSLACEPSGNGLLRVAEFEEYKTPREDVLTFIRYARSAELYFPKAFERLGDVNGLSEGGRKKLEVLWSHIEGYCYGNSAWTFLTTYLFNKSRFLIRYCSDTSVSGMQKRLALYQLLQFAHNHRGRPARERVDPKRNFLNYIRRLEFWGEERQFRQVPSWADDIDAVRMLTVHAAKGLEFSAVFIPSLGKGKFPVKGQGEFCPPPAGLIPTDVDWRMEEEECLFFVALSRARDWLCLSRAKRYGHQNSNASEFLYEVEAHLPRSVDIDPTWLDAIPPLLAKPVPQIDPSLTYQASDLEIYNICGHRFYIEVILGVFGNRADSGYLKFHRCVRRTLSQLRAEYRAGNRVQPDKALEMLEAHWKERKLAGEIHEKLYRREAERMVKEIAAAMLSATTDRLEVEWTVPLRNGRVVVTPDWVEVVTTSAGTRVLVRRLKTGRATKSSTPDEVVGLYIKGAEEAFPDAQRFYEVLYLMTNEVRKVDLPPKSLNSKLAVYEKAIDGIARGEFDAEPAERVCPKCAQYFICPIHVK